MFDNEDENTVRLQRPLILLTNDDSIAAPGIFFLAKCVKDIGDVYMVAPCEPQSGQAAAISVNKPLFINELTEKEYEGLRVFTVNGTPVDCVKMALHTIMPRKPDLLLSGINHGSNAAVNVTYSGTMGAVFEGCIKGITSVGFSLLSHSLKADFSQCASYITDIVQKVLAVGLPDYTCLNINMPAGQRPEGVKVCRAARGYWTEEYVRYLDPSYRPFFMLTGKFINEEPQAADTDEHWLSKQYISIVPCQPDLTHHEAVSALSRMFEDAEN